MRSAYYLWTPGWTVEIVLNLCSQCTISSLYSLSFLLFLFDFNPAAIICIFHFHAVKKVTCKHSLLGQAFRWLDKFAPEPYQVSKWFCMITKSLITLTSLPHLESRPNNYETKMSNPKYSLKNPTKFSFLLSTCLSDDTANRKCLFMSSCATIWRTPKVELFFSTKYQPCMTNKTALDWEKVKEASIFIFRLCCSPFDPESNESCTYKQVLLYGLEFI